MADNSKDSKILAYKDMINQLNKTISAQTELRTGVSNRISTVSTSLSPMTTGE